MTAIEVARGDSYYHENNNPELTCFRGDKFKFTSITKPNPLEQDCINDSGTWRTSSQEVWDIVWNTNKQLDMSVKIPETNRKSQNPPINYVL